MRDFVTEVLCRPNSVPTVPVALGVRSVCHGFLPAGRFEDQHIRTFVKIIWGIKGRGRVRQAGRVLDLPENSVALFLPGMRHEAWAVDEEWEVRWMTMNGPLCEEIVSACGLTKSGVYSAGPAPVDLFMQLREIIQDPTPESERRADAIAYKLLVSINLGSSKGTVIVEEAKSVILQNWQRPEFTINTLAKSLNVHRSRLSRLFSQEIEVSPMQYLKNLRMHHALNLLKASNLTVAEVAHQCGYNDTSHFCAVFKQLTGVTPGKYRQK